MITKFRILEELILEMVYTAINVVFLFQLHNLNEELLLLGLDSNAFELVMYENGKPLKYFALAVLLGLIGVMLAVKKLRHIRYDVLDFTDVVLAIIGIIVVGIIIILLWIFIDNPIARAVIAAFIVAGAVMAAN